MSMTVVLFLILFGFCSACKNSADCQLNGDCVGGACVCDKAWMGPNCYILNLKPAPLRGALQRNDVSSWGGSVVKIGNTYHMYAAEMANHCGLNTWGQNSIIIHAVSNTPEGPFMKQDVVMTYFSHNPTVVIAPDKTILIYHIGGGGGGNPRNCTNGSTPPTPLPPLIPQTGDGDFGILYSNSPNGPWGRMDQSRSTCDGSTSVQGYDCLSTDNPAPFINPDGSTLVLKRSWNTNAPLASLIGLAKASSWKGPYVHTKNPIFLNQNEDPFLYKNKRGYHAIFHGMVPYDQKQYAGRHAFSEDGTNWTFSQSPAYNSTVINQDGSVITYSRRERPHLLINENGEPTHLYTGVQKVSNDDYIFTHVQEIAN